MNKQEIESRLPNLLKTGYKITSPATPEYNCIAWAGDDNEVWWWPDPFDTSYWPPNIPRQETLESFVLAYATIGYEKCGDSDSENGFEKIAIYTDVRGKPTHAAKQLDNGHWTSKLGQQEDIEHTSLEGLNGVEYGAAIVFMKRPTVTPGTNRCSHLKNK